MTTALAALALLAAVNPPRRAAELDPRPRPSVGLLAAVIAASVVVGAAAVSGPALDWLAVSAPTLRIGAGLVLALRAVVDLVRRPRPEPEALAGWGEALYPIAVPVLVRPELVLLAMSAGADLGVGIAGALTALAVAAGAAAVVWWPVGRSSRYVGVAVSAAAAAAGVAVAVSGVFDV